MAGLLAAERGHSADLARARVDQVISDRELDIAAATRHERDRIAGELHDIVSHGLSIVIVQTAAARMTLSDLAVDDPVVDRRLGAAEDTAREALADMRRMLDLLRPDSSAAAETTEPSVGLHRLPELVEQARSAGLPVELIVELDGDREPAAGLDAAAYRLVQESLTNVLKHAPGAPTRVVVRRDGRTLEITVHNRAGVTARADPPRGATYGMIGMRQRTALYGGELQAGPVAEGFQVRAVFPISGVS